MNRDHRTRRCALLPHRAAASAAALALLLVPAASLAEPDPAEPTLVDMSLEELLELRLSGMQIAEIHHTHDAGEWMVGYMYTYMDMNGNLDGTSHASRSDVFDDGFMVSPTSMSMQMHMFHLMYAPHDRVTLSFMIPLLDKSMDHLVNPGAPVPFAGEKFTTRSSGPGDLRVSALVSLFRGESQRLVAELGWSVPTGSIDEKDETPMSMGTKVRLPYPMQLGSGTVDARPALTYLGQHDWWAWGARAGGIFRIGENDNDYALGDEWNTCAWGSRGLTEWLSTSVRLEAKGWGDIDGSDPALNPAMVPTADPNRRAGERIDALLGFNLFSSGGVLSGNRLALEAGLPLYQRLDGPQLETDWRVRVSWDWTFDSPFRFGR